MKVLPSLVCAVVLALTTLNGYAQTCSLTCPSNIVVKADSGQEGAIVTFPSATSLGIGDCGSITYSRPSGSFFRIGSHSIIASASFGQKCFFTITVADNEPPVLSPITLSTKKLSSASNRMKRVGVYYTASDNAAEVINVLSVSSNDPNSNSTNRDWQIINNHLVRLKSSGLSNGEPRVYTITVTSTDASGNITKRTTSISVAKPIALAYAANGRITTTEDLE